MHQRCVSVMLSELLQQSQNLTGNAAMRGTFQHSFKLTVTHSRISYQYLSSLKRALSARDCCESR
jgi:hypothetical protein